MQILEGIMIKAEDNIKLTTNDLEMAIECNVKADVVEKGDIVVNARLFGEIIRKCLTPPYILKQIRKQYNHLCENSKFYIADIHRRFSDLPKIEKQNQFKTNQFIIRDMIRQTIFAVGEDENRLF